MITFCTALLLWDLSYNSHRIIAVFLEPFLSRFLTKNFHIQSNYYFRHETVTEDIYEVINICPAPT